MVDKVEGAIKRVKSPHCLAGLTLFFASLLFFYDLRCGRYLLTERDLGPYFIPPRFFWVESLKNGDFPLWNPLQFTGHPFFANPQYGILYPLNSLFFLLPFDIAFNAIIILHFFLGGLFAYLFLKDSKVSTTGALISGLIFTLSGYLLSVHSLLNTLLSVIWTPLIMMFFRRAIGSRGFKNEIWVAIFVTLSFLGGGVEIVYGNFFLLLFMVIFPPFPNIEFVGDEPRRYKFFGSVPVNWERIGGLFNRFESFIIIFILFLLLSAVQLLPFLELFHHSIRWSGISYQEATTWSLAPKDVLLFFLPDAFGYFLDMKTYWVAQCWLKTLYTGGLPFILAALFFIFGKNRKLFLSLMLFSLFLSLGKYNPLYPFVFKYVPFFDGIRYPVKFLYILILVLSITAGFGFERLKALSKTGENKKMKHFLVISSLICGFFLLFLVIGHKEIESFFKAKGIDFPDFNHLSVNLYHAKRFFFYLALFFLLLRIGYEVKWKGWTTILLIFFLIAELFGNMGFYGKEKTSDYFKKTKILELIASDKGPFRTFSTAKTISIDTPILIAASTPFDALKEKHVPSMNLLYHLHNIWGIDVIRLKEVDELYRVFTGSPSISTTNLIDLYGVKYVVSVTPIEEGPRFELIYSRTEGLEGEREELIKSNTIKLYRNRNPLPRAWLVKDFRVMDSKAILSTMTSKEFHPDKEVLLEEEPIWTTVAIGGQHLPAGRQGGPPLQKTNDVGEPLCGLPQKVEFVSESNNRLRLKVTATGNALLVLSDTYYPGWKAYVHPVGYGSYNRGNIDDADLSNGVNGKEVRIYRANYNFRAIPLSAGIHLIEFVYDPMSLKIGVGVTFLGVLSCIVYILVTWYKRRGVPPRAPEIGRPQRAAPT